MYGYNRPGYGNFNAAYSSNQYKVNSVNTSPLQLVVMCYDGMLKFLIRAKESIQKKDIEGKVKNINKTLAIVEELQSSLDFAQGGEIARNLDRVYNYFNAELMKASMNSDLDKLSHIETLVQELRSAWSKIANEPTAPAPTAAPKPNFGFSFTG